MVADTFVRHAVHGFLRQTQVVAQFAAKLLQDDGIDGGKPADGAVGNQGSGHLLTAVAFKLERHGLLACGLLIAAAYGCQQQVVDVGIERAGTSGQESRSGIGVERHGEVAERTAVVFLQ